MLDIQDDEEIICSVNAKTYLFNESNWVSLDNGSNLYIYKKIKNKTYRIVSITNNNDIMINFEISNTTEYAEAIENFYNLTNDNSVIYGIKFSEKKDSIEFRNKIEESINSITNNINDQEDHDVDADWMNQNNK
eukprot:TRINITY_DN5726_c2_g2_i1.p1 TRINITY_DN5726_c2_g2~~TRINITY_DN5726_c2_g2_i1.p1  ORF type:complete len:134 (-),score=30.97 TRINITY_DN5726_c2_g2_i1:207-608(-)